MIYCPSCGSPNVVDSVVCDVCGAALPRTGATGAARPQPPTPQRPPQPPTPPTPPTAAADLSGVEKLGIFAGNLCLSPLLGVVLYFVWKDRHPRRAGQVCTLTWWTAGLYVVFILLMMALGIASEMGGT